MSAEPRVTVVMPAFNASSTIDTQLDALARQSFDEPWEIVVADNGSSDDTVARARSWRDRLPGLRVVDASARRGPSAARNTAAAIARAPLLLFCDADDAAERHWVRELVRALDDAEAASGGRRYSALNRVPHGPMDWTAPLFTKSPLDHLSAASSHNLGVRADVFAAIGGFDESLSAGEDVDLCWRLQLAGLRLAAAPEAVMQIRRRDGLLATFRQAVSYGTADTLLARKFAAVARPVSPSALPDPATRPAPGLTERLRTRGLRAPDPVYLAARWGRRRGERIGRRLPSPAPYASGDAG